MRVMIVDDSSTVRKILRRELERGDIAVVEARNGEEALATLDAESVDLVTMDVEMPGQNGFDVCAELRRREAEAGKPPVPVIFITANDTLKDRERGFELGAADFMTKPAPEGEILARVQKHLAAGSSLKGLTALVAEDSTAARFVTVQCLLGEGIEVLEAADGAEALALAEKRQDDIDLVVTDYVMPNMKGDELCRRLRQDLGMNQIPIIFLSAVAEKKYILDIFRAGATDYLLKPFAKEELLARIRVHLEVRQLNSKLQSQVEELTRLNKMQDDFLAVASHDLRSPLSGILGFADVLKDGENLNEEQKEFLGYIAESGEYLLSLINDILDLARIQSEARDLEFEPVNIADVISSSLRTLHHMASPKNIDLEMENRYGERSPYISGDANSLRRVMNNLVSNAIKFTPREGMVTVRLEPAEGADVCICVVDSGIGIPADKVPHLFDRFSKASREGTEGERSTGLGLAITKELVESHFGRIEVESVEGQGTTFRLFFPATRTPGE